jgi:phosphotransacetylase
MCEALDLIPNTTKKVNFKVGELHTDNAVIQKIKKKKVHQHDFLELVN